MVVALLQDRMTIREFAKKYHARNFVERNQVCSEGKEDKK